MTEKYFWTFLVLFWNGYNYLKTTIADLKKIFLNTCSLAELESGAHKWWWSIMTELSYMVVSPMKKAVFQYDAHFLRSINKRS